MVKGDLNVWAKPHFTPISTSSAVLSWTHYNCFFFPLVALSPGLAAALLWYSWGGSTICSIWNLKFCVWSLWPKSTIPVVKKRTWSVCFKKYKIRNPWGSKICICSFSSFKALFSKRDSLKSLRVTGSPWRFILSQLPILVFPLLQPGVLLCFVSHISPRFSETQRMLSAMTQAGQVSSMLNPNLRTAGRGGRRTSILPQRLLLLAALQSRV